MKSEKAMTDHSETTQGGTDTIRVGNLMPFSGGLGWIGPSAREGIETALTEKGGINDVGILDSRIRVIDHDTETSVRGAIDGFNALTGSDVQAVIGPTSTPAQSLVNLARELELLMVSPTAGTIQLDDVGGEFVWRTVPSDSVGARAQAKFAREELESQRMGVVYKNDRGSQSFSMAAGDYFESVGGSVVEEIALDPGARSFRRAVERLGASGATVVSMTAGTEVSRQFLHDYAEAGMDEVYDVLLGNDVVHAEFIDRVGPSIIEGILGQQPAPGPAFEAFEERYRRVADRRPAGFAASAYDAMNLIALAIERGGTVSQDAVAANIGEVGTPSGTKVQTFVEGKRALSDGAEINYVGAANPQNFDETGDPLGSFSIMQVTDNEWTQQHIYPASDLASIDE